MPYSLPSQKHRFLAGHQGILEFIQHDHAPLVDSASAGGIVILAYDSSGFNRPRHAQHRQHIWRHAEFR